MYRPLGDPNDAVRKNTLMVLTHLILNDMMKVGGGRVRWWVRVGSAERRCRIAGVV
jgi:condensin complex subunit 1